jgi:hypothetical protein
MVRRRNFRAGERAAEAAAPELSVTFGGRRRSTPLKRCSPTPPAVTITVPADVSYKRR